MMTKLAHMRENRKNNKGFSLVELIIVIAIMVALIAVMGPQYVKYIQKSRNSALASAAEDLAAWAKTAVADEDTNLMATGSSGTIIIKVVNKQLSVTAEGLSMTADQMGAAAGFSNGQAMGQTDYEYTITITSGATPTVTMVKTAG